MNLRALGLRCLRRFVEIEGAQQATVLAAQAFTSLIPFLVVASAIGPGDSDLADRIIERFGLEGDSARSVRSLFATAGEVEGAVTWVSVIILVLSTLSFVRALQRTFQRAYRQEPRGVADLTHGFAWLAALVTWVAVTSPLRESLEDVGGIVGAVALATALGSALWLWTPLVLLAHDDWHELVPGAVVLGALGALLGLASSIYVPILMDWSAERYGLIGIAFSLQSWMLVFAFVVVAGALLGAALTEERAREPAA